ncbi:leucyl aminopeptidase [Candidatus Pelagibacter sp.]|uniref:leucyl aminopeptidase n=1 Tax=Candidatus Pelagibacter sp. TaxID=2024849 RepID=UPI003F848C23
MIKYSLLNKLDIKNSKNITLFCNENFEIFNFKILGFAKEKLIKSLIQNNKVKNKKILLINLNDKQNIIVAKVNKNQKSLDNEKLGAEFYDFINSNSIHDISLINKNFLEKSLKDKFIDEFFHGIELKSYEFKKYKSKKNVNIFKFNIALPKDKKFKLDKTNRFKSLISGINFTKDLVSEPGNILHPDEYAKRLYSLKRLGLKVNILDEKKLKKLGMNSLLGVGQGSIRGSYLVCLEWNGAKNRNKPLAFVGKGVCFDTGGISLKPAKFMEDMTYDMAGSAVVVGLMKSLALRKAKVNAVGVVGLVENMPGGNAQRPGDIIKSYSGKTIEILNTDAEGRLVLADALTYTEKKYKPKFIVDLATLTGAIIVSLGSEYAGLFSNDDKLSNQLYEAGLKVEEKVWRMPLNENYNKLINSKNADMQNINYQGGAGSTTAAQFLQRFILNKTPWAHLDIAGMAFSKYNGALNSWGATGFGVRLLNKLIEDNYE